MSMVEYEYIVVLGRPPQFLPVNVNIGDNKLFGQLSGLVLKSQGSPYLPTKTDFING